MLLYVDDILIAGKSRSAIDETKAMLKSEFEMKDLGAARRLLGMDIYRDRSRGRLWLSQSQYIEKVLRKFHMSQAKPISTPLAAHFRLSTSSGPKDAEEERYMSRVPYACDVGSLMYAMVCTCPDFAYAVSVVNRFMSKPGKEHWKAVRWILRYLRGTSKYGLMFDQRAANPGQVVGFSDLDFAGDLDWRRSLTGYVFQLCGSCVSWKATLQHTIALSTTEAEFMSLTEAAKEAIWLHGFLNDLGIEQVDLVVFCDNQSAIHLAKYKKFHERTKHIDVRSFFIQLHVRRKTLYVEKVGTKDNPDRFVNQGSPKVQV